MSLKNFTNKNLSVIFLLIISVFFLISLTVFNFLITKEQQYSYLAQSFLSGKLYFLNSPGSWGDAILHDGFYFWPNPPFPAILILPFFFLSQIFGKFFYQGYLQIFLVVGVYLLCYLLARFLRWEKISSHYLSLAFVGGSSFLGVALWPWSWFFAHVVVVFLVFISLYEYYKRKRFWLIGVYFGAIFLTRFTAGLGILFFILSVLILKSSITLKIKKLLQLLFPVFLSILILFSYNYARFGNILETGYKSNFLSEIHDRDRSYGVFSYIHLPSNLYYMFLNIPTPVIREGTKILQFPYIKADAWGMSILVTSPYLLGLFFIKKFKKESIMLLLTSIIISIPIIFYFGIGWRQYGYRYSLDFLPYIFFVFMSEYGKHKLSDKFKILISLSVIWNFYLFLTLFI